MLLPDERDSFFSSSFFLFFVVVVVVVVDETANIFSGCKTHTHTSMTITQNMFAI